jgi:hypothetical protein
VKEPWFNNISWPKLAGLLTFAGLLLNQLRTSPIPESYKPWAEFAASLVAVIVGFILNPKDKPWVSDESMEAVQVAPPPAPSMPSSPTAEQMALIAEILQRGQRP